MSNQEPQNPDKTTEEAAVDNRRRFIKGASAAVPVILTLASPSVFGLEANRACYSQQLSGNLMSGEKSFTCSTGNPPSWWRDPAHKGLWPSGFSYGTLPSGKTNICSNYTGGTLFNASIAFAGATTGTNTLRSFLCGAPATNNNPPVNAVWAAALLNSVAVPNYILKKQDVLDMYKGLKAPPSSYPNNSAGKVAYLRTTWVGN